MPIPTPDRLRLAIDLSELPEDAFCNSEAYEAACEIASDALTECQRLERFVGFIDTAYRIHTTTGDDRTTAAAFLLDVSEALEWVHAAPPNRSGGPSTTGAAGTS